MAETISYVGLGLNTLLIPLLVFFWKLSTAVVRLEVKVEQCSKETADLRTELMGARAQVIAAATAAATAAASAATAVAASRYQNPG